MRSFASRDYINEYNVNVFIQTYEVESITISYNENHNRKTHIFIQFFMYINRFGSKYYDLKLLIPRI